MQDKEDKTIDQDLENDTDFYTSGQDEAKDQKVSKGSWDDVPEDHDEFDGRDGGPPKELYNLSIPNNETLDGGKPNPGYHRLCLDRQQTIPPTDMIECVVLARLRPNIAQLPYTESKGMPAYEKMIGYSFDGVIPTPDTNGAYMEQCTNGQGVPFQCCSIPPPYDPNSKTSEIVALTSEKSGVGSKQFPYLSSKKRIKTSGECPNARWGNTLPAKDLKLFGLRKSSKPTCIQNVILLAYHLELEVYFTSYWKIKSKPSVEQFIKSFRLGGRKRNLRQYVAEITVEQRDTFVIPSIFNTRTEANRTTIDQVWDYFCQNKDKFLRNAALVMQELRTKDKEAEDFKKPEGE